ncbi:amidase [Candidatus Neomarinimicrobiota bacterium]
MFNRLFFILLPLIFIISCESNSDTETITKNDIIFAQRLIGLEFNDAKRDSMVEGINVNLENYLSLREYALQNSVVPALLFNPIPVGVEFEQTQYPLKFTSVSNIKKPDNLEEVALWTIRELAELIRSRQVTAVELTEMYLSRLKKYGPSLECVITLTEELALQQAERADREIAAGHYKGYLHGIPYGAKDLLAVKNYKTTWGAVPYQDQMINEDAVVIQKLEEAGAILVAKLTLGALAWGDVWFGGKTRNPWNLEQGSSGSSAGPGSATAAGLVGFSIGTETWGSIVSPSTRNGVSGLRPTYGRVSRIGAMALSWSMDKIGPMCRSVEDCAIVFNAIYGPDGIDQTLVSLPFNYNHDVDVSELKIGFLKTAFEDTAIATENDINVLDVLRTLGSDLIPIELPEYPVNELSFILSAEAAAAFDELTLNGEDDNMVRQIKNAWPNEFRTARFIPAVEYIRANRIRTQLIQDMGKLMRTIDVYVAPSFGGDNLLRTNLTGHPCVVLPNGFNSEGSPSSISFIGNLFDEGKLLAVAQAYQQATDWHRQYPDLDANVEKYKIQLEAEN